MAAHDQTLDHGTHIADMGRGTRLRALRQTALGHHHLMAGSGGAALDLVVDVRDPAHIGVVALGDCEWRPEITEA